MREGLQDLVRVIGELHIRSIALPPLGSGNGKLDWILVRSEIEHLLGELVDVDVLVFEESSPFLVGNLHGSIV